MKAAAPGCEIGMEACAGAHHWARQLQARGYVVKLIAPQFVKPYVKSNKNDARDAEAICEAMSRPSMRFVGGQDGRTTRHPGVASHPLGSSSASARQRRTRSAAWWRNMAWLHRSRMVPPCATLCPDWLEDAENGLSILFRRLLKGLWEDLKTLDGRVTELDHEIKRRLPKAIPTLSALQQLRGVGPMIATALVAAVGNA